MAKVIFEFDESEEKQDLNIIINRDKLVQALTKLAELRSVIVNNKFYRDELIYVKNNKVLDINELTYELDKEFENSKEYLDKEYIEDRIGSILEDMYEYLDY